MLAPEFLNRIIEKLELKKPCQEGYEQIGMKMKDGKKVPNCVPIKAKEDLSSDKVELAMRDYDSFESDLKKLKDDNSKVKSKYDTLKKEIINLRKEASSVSIDISRILDRAKSQVEKDVKAARDLGVDTKPFMNKYRSVTNTGLSIQKESERIIQETGKVR